MEGPVAAELAPGQLPMKILLNGLPIAYPISGVGQYTLQLGRGLEALLGSEKIFWFGTNGSRYGLEDSDSEGGFFINHLQLMLKNNFRKIPGLKRAVHIWRNLQFRSYARGVRPSLYHETNYVPFHFEYGPTVITICDLSFVRYPEWHPADRVKYFKKYCLNRLSEVDAIITISEFSKKEIMNLLGVNPAKIYVTPLGVDRSFTPGGKKMKGLPNEYILFLGNLEPRKNLPTLLQAYQLLPRSLRNKFPLVITGASGWHTKELKKALLLFESDEKPIFMGYVSQRLLPDLYRGASLFVYPSFYEGFGLPIIEAMASGVPVIASDTTSLPEVVGDAGALVNPYDVHGWKDAMIEVLKNEAIREGLSEKGLERAKLFSWEQCARGTLGVYQKALGEGR